MANLSTYFSDLATGAVYITSARNAINGDGIFADTSGGAFTVTLPASPNAGDNIAVFDLGDASNNNITVARNGETIDGLAEDFTIDENHGNVRFIYTGTTWEVNVFTPGAGLTQAQVDARVDLYQPEIGTFSPILYDDDLDDAGQTYSEQLGKYRKTGDLVHFWLQITMSSLGSLTTSHGAKIGGLPFTANGLFPVYAGIGQNLNITSTAQPAGYVSSHASNYITVNLWDAGTGTTNMTIAELSADGRLFLSGTYLTDD